MNQPYFQKEIETISAALDSVDTQVFETLIAEVCTVLESGAKVIITGVGKNFPVCQKLADSMQSIGLQVFALNASDALHGSMGIIGEKDLVIVLSKSGETKELITLLCALKGKAKSFLITFTQASTLSSVTDSRIAMELAAEGDLWNMIPNNSTAVFLILLQAMATQVQKKLNLDLQKDFLAHHPGGNIGAEHTVF